jgi:replicative DNA helicase
MKRILRSLIDVSDDRGFPTISNDDLKSNFIKVRDIKLEMKLSEDHDIFEFIRSYFHSFRECPSILTIYDKYNDGEHQSLIDRLDEIKDTRPYIKSNFENLIIHHIEEQHEDKCKDVLSTAIEILNSGVTINISKRKQEHKKGYRDALKYIVKESDELLSTDLKNTKLKGNVRDNIDMIQNVYFETKNDPSKKIGRFCGLSNIDMNNKGIKKGELWIHAAYTGEMKTTFAVNWAYNNCTRYGWNSYYLSLEMPYEQLNAMIWCLHSANNKFISQGYKPVDYRKYRDGNLTNEEEDYFFNVVCRDFSECDYYGNIFVERTVEDLTIPEIKSLAEMYHQDNPIDLMFIDHGGLVPPTIHTSDFSLAQNSVIRDAKKLALNFDNGQGIPLVLLFQINRQGKAEADKKDGHYRMRDLSYANEAEKSADVITYTYLDDELRKDSKVKFGNLKNRDNPLFDQFQAEVIFSCRRIYNLELGTISDTQVTEQTSDILKFLG